MTAGEAMAVGDENRADPEAMGTDAGAGERRAGIDRRDDGDRRGEDDRRGLRDRRGSGLRTPSPPGAVRPYAFRSFDDRRTLDERRTEADRRGPDDRRWDRAGAAVTLTQEELDALLGPTED